MTATAPTTRARRRRDRLEEAADDYLMAAIAEYRARVRELLGYRRRIRELIAARDALKGGKP